MNRGTQDEHEVRTAELAASLCLATDLGMGFPFEHGLRSTLIAMRLADAIGVDTQVAKQTYYACLLMYAGCTTDAHEDVATFRGSLTEHVLPRSFGSRREIIRGVSRALPAPGSTGLARAFQIASGLPRAARHQPRHFRAICEVAQMLSGRFRLSQDVRDLFRLLTERWDGKSVLKRAEGDEIPLALRIVHVARDAALQRLLGGEGVAVDVIRERAGGAFDPQVAGRLVEDAGAILAIQDTTSAWDGVLEAEPRPYLTLTADDAEDALGAMGDFSDLISPWFSGHSSGVARLAARAARECRLDDDAVIRLRRAALLHEVGRVAVHPAIWLKPGPLDAGEWEQVRLHPYQTERTLSRSLFLVQLSQIAAAHHERLDGSGYHRAATSAVLDMPSRLLAVADAFHAMTQSRPYRDALTAEHAADLLAEAARDGKLDADAVSAVVGAAGQPPPKLERPAGLTERELEVVALIARGLQTKQVARALGISIKTADHHLQNAYRKIGVSTRAAATLFAMQHGLVSWGELPIVRPHARP